MAIRKRKKLEPQAYSLQKSVAEDDNIVGMGISLLSVFQNYHKWVVAFLGLIQPYLVKFGFDLDTEILKKPSSDFYLTVFSQTAPFTRRGNWPLVRLQTRPLQTIFANIWWQYLQRNDWYVRKHVSELLLSLQRRAVLQFGCHCRICCLCFG